MSGRAAGVLAGALLLFASAAMRADGGTPPGEFNLTSPDEGSTFNLGEHLYFRWAGSAGALTFTLTIATDASLADVVYSSSSIVSLYASELTFPGDYYWGVTASNSDGDTDSTPSARSIVVVADTFPPSITATYPGDGALGVGTDRYIEVLYDERIDEASIDGAVTVTGPRGEVAGTQYLRLSGRSLVFTPDADLECETTYTVTIAATVTDLAGNAVGETYEFSFTTWEWLTGIGPEMVCTPGAAGNAAAWALRLAALAGTWLKKVAKKKRS